MLVDDDQLINTISEKFIRKIYPHIQVLAFQNPNDALLHLRLAVPTPEIVFVDLDMPEISGWDFLEECSLHGVQSIFYLLTSSLDEDDQQRSQKYPFVRGFLSKPLTVDNLRHIMG